jgi:hypothetical protein
MAAEHLGKSRCTTSTFRSGVDDTPVDSLCALLHLDKRDILSTMFTAFKDAPRTLLGSSSFQAAG